MESASDTLTVDKLLEIARAFRGKFEPPPRMFSWSHAPADKAWMIKVDGVDWIYAHPAFWARIPERNAPMLACGGFAGSALPPSMMGMRIEDVDAVEGEEKLKLIQPLLDTMARPLAQRQG